MPGIKRGFYDVCPDCWSVRVKFRVFKSPRYKCEKCGSEFPNKKRISRDDRILFNNLMKIARDNPIGANMKDIELRKRVVIRIKETRSHA